MTHSYCTSRGLIFDARHQDTEERRGCEERRRRSCARSGLCQNDQLVVLGERDALGFLRVQVYAVRGARLRGRSPEAVAHGHLFSTAGGYKDGVEVFCFFKQKTAY